ncbi:hypothetical protein GCM10009096_26480 [Parasphingorhabdus litoris]|uniref:Uncharacterized protein n=1 Tax=Parasphingorhabdus litoris TaxID=394733 RepID=A0ABP3KMD1_9SPHN|nr:hypothetical protein [Parasphingorhabdus litoris]
MKLLSFRNVWRFNAIAIALIVLFGIAAMIFVAVDFLSYRPDHRGFGSVSSQSSATEDGKVHLAFSEWVDLPGTTLAAMKFGVTDQLESNGSSFGSGSKYKSNTVEERNIILLDRADGSFRHIVPDNDRKLLNWYVLTAGESKDNKDRKAIGFVAQFVSRSHTENSSEIVMTDILLGSFLTGRQKWIITEVEALDYPKLVETEAATMIIWSEGRARFLRVGLDDLEIEIDQEISMVPNSQ